MKFPTFSTEVTHMSYCGTFNTNLTFIHWPWLPLCLQWTKQGDHITVWVRKHNYTSSRMMILKFSLVQVPRLTLLAWSFVPARNKVISLDSSQILPHMIKRDKTFHIRTKQKLLLFYCFFNVYL